MFNVLNPPDTNIDELTLLTVTNAAMDADIPANPLTYTVVLSLNTAATLANGWPLSSAPLQQLPSIDANGVITWKPGEAQGPGVYTLTTIVTDTNPWAFTNNSLSTTNTFNVTVNEVNHPPVLLGIPDTNVFELSTLTMPVIVTDSDIPTNTLTYSLVVNDARFVETLPHSYQRPRSGQRIRHCSSPHATCFPPSPSRQPPQIADLNSYPATKKS